MVWKRYKWDPSHAHTHYVQVDSLENICYLNTDRSGQKRLTFPFDFPMIFGIKYLLNTTWSPDIWFVVQIETCWFHGSSFKGFSIVFPAPRLAEVESSQKSNGIYVFRHFSRHSCSTIAESIGLTNYAASFDAKKMFRKPKLKMLKWLSVHGTNKLNVRFDSVSLVNNVE